MKKRSNSGFCAVPSRKAAALIECFCVILIFVFALFSCGKKSSPTSPSRGINVTGTWIGFYVSSLIPSTPVTLNLTQASTTVSGTYLSPNGVTGTVSGRVKGHDIVDFSLIDTTPWCPGEFNGSAAVSGDTMDFIFTGSDCRGFHSDGHGRVICDKTPPAVVSMYPTANDTGVSIYADVTVTFSETMDTTTITGATFTLKDAGNNTVTGAVTSSGDRATFSPSPDLTKGVMYTATIATGVKDLSGNPLAAKHVWKFTTSAFTSTYPTPEGWSPGAPMLSARSWGASAVVDDHIFVFGGSYYSAEKYNPSMNAWTVLPDMPFGAFLIRGAAVNGKIYIFGGSMDMLMYSYNPNFDGWIKLKDFPDVEWIGAPAVVNGKIYVFGGYDNDIGATDVSLEYNPVTDAWATKKPMPTKRYAPATAVYNNKIFVLGGNYGSDRNEVYDPAADSWQTKASIPFNNYGWGVAGTINGKIYFVDSDTYYNPGRMGIYTISNDTWTVVDGLAVPRRYLTGEVVDGRLYVIGGMDDNSEESANLDIYTPSALVKPFRRTISRDVRHGVNECDFYLNEHLMREKDLRERLRK